MATFTQGPPDLNTPVDSVGYRQWFEEVFTFLEDVPDLKAQNTFSGQMNIWGSYLGTGQLYVKQQVNDPAGSNWAIVGQVLNQAPMSVTGNMVGGFFQTQAYASGDPNSTMWGVVTELINGQIIYNANGSKSILPGTSSVTMVGAELGLINQYSGNTSRLAGVNLVFKDRDDGATSPPSGLGSNQYNNNSTAVMISSQPRSSAGEFCGWSVGIYFEAVSMDNIVGSVSAVGIDMHNVPSTSMNVGLWMNDLCDMRFDNAGTISMGYHNPDLRFAVSGAEMFAINMTNGRPIFHGPTVTSAAAGTATALPALPAGYMTATVGGTTVHIPYYA